jgi:hypothetical protein
MTKEEYKITMHNNKSFLRKVVAKDKMNTVSGKKLLKRDTVIWKVFLPIYAEWEK